MKTSLLLYSIDNNGHGHNKTSFQEIKAFIMKLSTQYHFRGKNIICHAYTQEYMSIYNAYTQEYMSVYKGDWGRRREEGTQGRRKGKGKSGSVVKPHIAPVA